MMSSEASFWHVHLPGLAAAYPLEGEVLLWLLCQLLPGLAWDLALTREILKLRGCCY